jgi:hypothetical protein
MSNIHKLNGNRTLIVYFFLSIIIICFILSTSTIRRKLASYLLEQNKDILAIKVYERLIRKDIFYLTPGKDTHLLIKDELTHFHLLCFSLIRNSFLNIIHLIDSNFEGESLLEGSFEQLPQLLNKFVELRNQSKYDEIVDNLSLITYLFNILNKNPELFLAENIHQYLESLYHIFIGIIDQKECKYLSAISNYEKSVTLISKLLHVVNQRRNQIFLNAVQEFMFKFPILNKIGASNIIIQSEYPLIIKGVIANRDNYLSYDNCSVPILIYNFPKPSLQIKGEVIGKDRSSCIVPRVVFWEPHDSYLNMNLTPGRYIGESFETFFVRDKFEIIFQFNIPPRTTILSPRITFDAKCFSGQQIIINEVCWN